MPHDVRTRKRRWIIGRAFGSMFSMFMLLATGCLEDQSRFPEVGVCSQTASLPVPDETRGGLEEGPHTVLWERIRFWYCVSGNPGSEHPPLVFLHGGPGQGSQHLAALFDQDLLGWMSRYD
jgi:hypothetical protein